jgi:hypothetical protein
LANDRAESNYSDDDADIEIRKRVQGQRDRVSFSTVHVFPEGAGDVPDEDDGVRLVVLPPAVPHKSNGDESEAVRLARSILDQRHGGPRINRNLLVFLAADSNLVSDLRKAARNLLAWSSILAESGAEGLDLTDGEKGQVETRIREAEETVVQQIGEAFQHLLVPKQTPNSSEVTWSGTRATGKEDLAIKASRKLESSEDLIPSYGGIRVRMDLDRPEAVLWDGDHIAVRKLWGYYCQ